MTASSICILIAMICYLALVIYIGFRNSKKNETSADFYLGGRKLGPYVTAMSAEASDMSSYLLMGLPGLAYLSGLADVTWTVIGLGVGTYLNWLFTAKRLRRYSQITNSYTLPQFFSNRYKDKKCILTFISALIIIVFFVPYTGSGFAACGKLFNSLFGIDYHVAMIICAVVIILYTTAGGFTAASTTDFIQSIVMTIALIAILIFATVQAGGPAAVVANAQSLDGYFSMFSTYSETTGTGSPYTALTIITTLSWGLGYFGMPHILLRFMAIEDENKLKVSRRVGTVWVFIAMAIAICIGLVGNALGHAGITSLLTGSNTETVVVEIATLLSGFGIIPALLAGIVLAGILASTMSTADSQLLAASSSVSENLLKETFHVKVSEKANMTFARITVIIIAILGVIIAWDSDSSIFNIVSFAWAGFGATFGPTMILALFWKRSTLPGAISGLICGGVMVFVWEYVLTPLGGIFAVYELLPAFIVGIVVNIIVSLCTKAPSDEITSEYDLAKSKAAL